MLAGEYDVAGRNLLARLLAARRDRSDTTRLRCRPNTPCRSPATCRCPVDTRPRTESVHRAAHPSAVRFPERTSVASAAPPSSEAVSSTKRPSNFARIHHAISGKVKRPNAVGAASGDCASPRRRRRNFPYLPRILGVSFAREQNLRAVERNGRIRRRCKSRNKAHDGFRSSSTRTCARQGSALRRAATRRVILRR